MGDGCVRKELERLDEIRLGLVVGGVGDEPVPKFSVGDQVVVHGFSDWTATVVFAYAFESYGRQKYMIHRERCPNNLHESRNEERWEDELSPA